MSAQEIRDFIIKVSNISYNDLTPELYQGIVDKFKELKKGTTNWTDRVNNKGWHKSYDPVSDRIKAFSLLKAYEDANNLSGELASGMFTTTEFYTKYGQMVDERMKSLTTPVVEDEQGSLMEEEERPLVQLAQEVESVKSRNTALSQEQFNALQERLESLKNFAQERDVQIEAKIQNMLNELSTRVASLQQDAPDSTTSPPVGQDALGSVPGINLSSVNVPIVATVAGLGLLTGLATSVITDLLKNSDKTPIQNVFNIRSTSQVKKEVPKEPRESVAGEPRPRVVQPHARAIHAIARAVIRR